MTEGPRTTRGRNARKLALLTGLLFACAKTPSPPAAIQPRSPPSLAPPPSGWPYWQAPLLALRPSAGASVPSSEDAASSEPEWLKSDEVWRKDSGPLFSKLREQGLAIHRTRRFETALGAFYEERARRGAPLLITTDALLAIAHLAIADAFADVETRVERVDMITMLHRLDARLSAEVGRARPDLLGGYRLARSTVAVSLAVVDPSYGVPSDLADVVSLEVGRIRAHRGVEQSPLFEAAIDYGAMSARGAVASDDPSLSIFEAAEWLAQAPFLLEGRGEVQGAEVDVGTARTHTRAALLLARLLTPEGDLSAAAAFARLDRIDLFAVGAVDDLSPGDLARIARSNGIDLQGGSDIVNTAKLDHLRHAASRAPALFDGSGRVRRAGDGGTAPWRPQRSMRLAPLRATPDGRLLEQLVFPFLGILSLSDSADSPPVALPTFRTMPSGLDVAAWLESSAAKLALASHGDPRYTGFERALASAVLPSDELSRHGSLFSSQLDAISTWLRRSSVEEEELPPFSEARDRRKLDAALVGWTLLRHDALAFGHRRVRVQSAPVSTLPARSLGRVFVEPHPEAIASLLGMIRQTRRGLVEVGALAEDAPSLALLDETESIFTLALEGAVRAASREPSFADLTHALGDLPARMAALEQRAGFAADPVVIDVHLDIASEQVLEEATGTLDELFVRVQDPVEHRSVIAVGACIPHFEFTEKASARRNDAAWAAQLQSGQAPKRDSFAEVDLVAPE
jgi:hypothetical protein